MDFLSPLSEIDRLAVATALGQTPGHLEFTAGYVLYQTPVWKAISSSDAALEFQEAYTAYRQRGEGTADGLTTLVAQVKEELGDKVGAEAVKEIVSAFESVLARYLKSINGPAC